MPSAHRNALKKLLASIEKRIAEDEGRLMEAKDGLREELIQQIADLELRRKEIIAALLGGSET